MIDKGLLFLMYVGDLVLDLKVLNLHRRHDVIRHDEILLVHTVNTKFDPRYTSIKSL